MRLRAFELRGGHPSDAVGVALAVPTLPHAMIVKFPLVRALRVRQIQAVMLGELAGIGRATEALSAAVGRRVMLEKLPSGIGRAMRGLRARESQLLFHHAALDAVPAVIRVTSPEFPDHGVLPTRYTADGEGLSPPLAWTGVPAGARSLVIIVEGADSPTPLPLVHAIEWGLAGANGELPAGALPRSGESRPADVLMGRNSLLMVGYLPPDPPSGHGIHRYAFEVFALDSRVQFNRELAPGRRQVEEWLIEHAIAKGMLIALYSRP